MKLHDVPNGSFAATQSSAVDEAEVEDVERSASFEPLELESNEDDEADLLNSSSPASRARARAPFPALAALSALLKCRPCACTQGQARLGPCIVVPLAALVFVTVAAVVVALLVTATGHKETGYESDAPSIPSTGCLSPMVGPTLPGSYAETIIVDGIKVSDPVKDRRCRLKHTHRIPPSSTAHISIPCSDGHESLETDASCSRLSRVGWQRVGGGSLRRVRQARRRSWGRCRKADLLRRLS